MITIKYRRKSSIFQTQLVDFIGMRSDERYESWIPSDYRVMRKKFKKWLPVSANRGEDRQAEYKVNAAVKPYDMTLKGIPVLAKYESIRVNRALGEFRAFSRRYLDVGRNK